MTPRDKLRLLIEFAVATAVMAAGGWLVRYAHGQVVDDRSDAACAANKQWLEANWRLNRIVKLPYGTLFLKATASTPSTIGCGGIEASGPTGYWVPSDHPTLVNVERKSGDRQPIGSRICQLTPGITAIRICGVQFVIDRYPMFEGQGDAAAIEVEGRSAIATGHHRLHVNAHNWRHVVRVLGGYYRDGAFVADENHGDNSTLDCTALNCDTLIRLENQQALNWRLDCFWQGKTDKGEAVAIDCVRGGSLSGRITVENARCKILRLGDYSDNQCKFDLDVWFDSMLDPNPEFVLVELTKPDLFWAQWFITMRGWSGKQPKPVKDCIKFAVPANTNRSGWKIDLDYVGKQQPK